MGETRSVNTPQSRTYSAAPTKNHLNCELRGDHGALGR